MVLYIVKNVKNVLKCEKSAIFDKKQLRKMLIRFSIENYLSFKERQTFSMIAGRGGRDKNFHLIKKEKRNDIALLKTSVISGANASGKSNLIKAISFGKRTILDGTPVGKPIKYQKFKLHKECEDSLSRLEFEIKVNNISYAYGFSFNSTKIEEEWLYEIDKIKETLIFKRKNVNEFDLQPLLRKNNSKSAKQFLNFIAKGTPDNQLFLTEIRNRKVSENVSNIDDLLNIIDWMQNTLTIIYPGSRLRGIEFELKRNTKLTSVFNEFLNYYDTGIDGIVLEEIAFDKVNLPDNVKEEIKSDLLEKNSDKTNAWVEDSHTNMVYIFSKEKSNNIIVRKLMTEHKVHGVKDSICLFDKRNESDGTQRIMDLIPLFIDLFKENNVFIVDEMERSLHPNLIYDLMDLFLEKSQGIKSQLILASHESCLITQKLLRKDEIWFAVKDEIGATSIYSLEDYDIRYDKQIRKDYLLGRYKAIPRFGNRNELSIINH